MKNILDNSHIEQVGGDFHIGDINNYEFKKDRVQFEVVDTTPFEQAPPPIFTEEVEQRINKHQLLIVGGNYNFNKNSFLKSIAARLNHTDTLIKECIEVSNFHSLSSSIQQKKEEHIFIINNINPKQINHKFQELRQVVRKTPHQLLLCTDVPYDGWDFNEDMTQSFWFEVPDNNIYAPLVLHDYLAERLEALNLKLPVKTATLAQQFQTIAQIDTFTEVVNHQEDTITASDLSNLLSNINRYNFSNINQWFNALKEEQKLLVIGLTLLDGIYESQFFEIIDRIIKQAWHSRHPELTPIDYGDLIPLFSFFKIDGKIVRSKYTEQRQRLLKTAWRTHRRYILSAVPILTDLVFESLAGGYTNWSLFGTKNYRDQIRRVIGETFSTIGLLSLNDIEGELIRLATFPDLSSKVVVAKIIAYWKILGEEQRVFTLFKRWHYSNEIDNLVKVLLNQHDQKTHQSSKALIESTTALTIGYLAQLDAANKVQKETLNLLDRLHSTKKEPVKIMLSYSIERVTSFHFEQVVDLLKDRFLQYIHFAVPIGHGIAQYYNNGYTHEVAQIIHQWLSEIQQHNENRNNHTKLTQQDHMILAITRALQYIDYTVENPAIALKETYSILKKLREEHHQKVIRQQLLRSIFHLIELNFFANEQLSIQAIPNIDAQEREIIVQEFREKYLDQRSQLDGGEYNFSIDGYKLSAWSDPKERPETKIEVLLRDWKKSAHDIFMQIAIKSYGAFDEIEITEQAAIESYHIHQKRKQKAAASLETPTYTGAKTANKETITFTKLCSHFIKIQQEALLKNTAIYLLQEAQYTSIERAQKQIERLDDNPADNDFQTVDNILFVYRLFRTDDFYISQHPIAKGFRTYIFTFLAAFMVKKTELLHGLAPFLFKTELNSIDRNVLWNKIQKDKTNRLEMLFFACKYFYFTLLAIFLLFIYFYSN